jgi:hypothetical protein
MKAGWLKVEQAYGTPSIRGTSLSYFSFTIQRTVLRFEL